jgi:hypothetical protein
VSRNKLIIGKRNEVVNGLGISTIPRLSIPVERQMDERKLEAMAWEIELELMEFAA